MPYSSRRIGSLINMYFTETPPVANLLREEGDTMRLVHLAGMNHGLYFASRGFLVLNTLMTEAHIDAAVEKFQGAFADAALERTK